MQVTHQEQNANFQAVPAENSPPPLAKANTFPNSLLAGNHCRGFLPHVKREGVSYFVTFRLADSLPQNILTKLFAERETRVLKLLAQRDAFEKGLTQKPPQDSEEKIEQDYQRAMEKFLDKGLGACDLRQPEIADLVSGAIQNFDLQRYELREWVVMPNHVHALLWPMPGHTLSDILKSWKGYTGRWANQKLSRRHQPFWQPESYDHWIRNDEEKARICRYIRNNPVKAGLCRAPEDWRWSSCWSGLPSVPQVSRPAC
jgi:REP element-mobilizing transposase RayT